MRVRPLENNPDDIDALTDLMNQWDDVIDILSPEQIQIMVNDIEEYGNSAIFLLEADDGFIAGYVYVTELIFLGIGRVAEIQSILVDQDYRGNAYGAQLLRAAEEWCASRKIEMIMLSSRIHLDSAHAFYNRHGYEKFKQSYYFKKKIMP